MVVPVTNYLRKDFCVLFSRLAIAYFLGSPKLCKTLNKLQIEIYSGNMTQNLSQKFKFDIEDFLEALHKACSLLEDN
jgi:hypothetical protein